MSKINVPEKEPGFIRYIIAANATTGGSLIAFLIAGLIFFPLGYYTKYKRFKQQGVEIVQQSIENKTLDDIAYAKMETSKNNLTDSLRYIGYDSTQIQELISSKPNKLDKIKYKFIRYVKGDTIYLPRDDCENDYLGENSSNQANKIIMKGYNNRYLPNE